jgi:hypothetical protein
MDTIDIVFTPPPVSRFSGGSMNHPEPDAPSFQAVYVPKGQYQRRLYDQTIARSTHHALAVQNPGVYSMPNE